MNRILIFSFMTFASAIFAGDFNLKLIDAAKKGYLGNVSDFIVKHQAHPDARDAKNRTPLHLAAKNNHLAVVKYLLENGAALDPKDNTGQTPLLYAVLNKHLPIMEILLRHGADIHTQATLCITPLSAGKLMFGKQNIPAFLTSTQSAPCSSNSIFSSSTLQASCSTPTITLNQYKPTHIVTSPHITLLDAVKMGNLEWVRTILAAGDEKFDDTAPNGSMAIHFAAQIGHTLLIEYFLDEHKMSPDTPGWHNRTPLHWAIGNNNPAVLMCLQKHGATIDAKDLDGATPLHVAAEFGNITSVGFLLEHGANIEANNHCETTPLMFAASKGHLETVKFLVSRGANLNAENINGITPIIAACEQGHEGVVNFLSAAQEMHTYSGIPSSSSR